MVQVILAVGLAGGFAYLTIGYFLQKAVYRQKCQNCPVPQDCPLVNIGYATMSERLRLAIGWLFYYLKDKRRSRLR